ncbi:NLI interacting factor-like phosphatase (macronuclear) [Tetrahymena thermophila SB210]|uniref:NLI interacting factor-like phosphatase n=1 Tax=Tetrahymena thermophila (strain SB210) TaxID=312017 RepID=I7MHG7_TETTS|nr:NLI interacting factor-like phosphatase [Tetrahymena thermophila SB210]EAS02959.2 NLI interacting factor-like phosphatase [Tetrahymena thermophila SB210]|eukprot:XP_001023204.2 NLI interacting factor-like phosphatase [Tetrahymena thermophila SB210]
MQVYQGSGYNLETCVNGKLNQNTSMHLSTKTKETLPCEYDLQLKNEDKDLKEIDQQPMSLYAKLCQCLNIFQSQKKNIDNYIIQEFVEEGIVDRQPVKIPPQEYDLVGKKTLVLDLDETLITSSVLEFKSADLKIKVNLPNGRGKNVWVKFRPGVQNFLNEMNELYELIIFTSSIKEYANAVIDFLDCESLVNVRIFRENCSIDSNGNLYKDLCKLNRNIGEIIIIDNQASQFKKNPENGIQIKDFKIDNNSDQELLNLIPFLKFMSSVKDVRNIQAYMNDYYSGNVINYIDINGMQCQFQRGIAVEESRLQTEKTESKIDPIDLKFNENESSNLGDTIKLDSKEYKKQDSNSMINHFEDDIDAAIKIQQSMNKHNNKLSNDEVAKPIKKSPEKNQHKEKESQSEKKHIFKNIHKVAAKTVFDFTQFKQSLFNKLGSINDPEKENIQANVNLQNVLQSPVYSNLQDVSSEQSAHCISKEEIEHNQNSTIDNSEQFIKRPKRKIIQPHKRRCASQAIKFIEVNMKEENFNSPNTAKEV